MWFRPVFIGLQTLTDYTFRYFQIARCYRDEGGRGDRQPEFTQIDLELSFTSQREIEDIIEELVVEMWQEGANVLPQRPFQRMSYSEAMSRFGVDKPDLRCDAPQLSHPGLHDKYAIHNADSDSSSWMCLSI